jgi:predicted transcriptional regulator
MVTKKRKPPKRTQYSKMDKKRPINLSVLSIDEIQELGITIASLTNSKRDRYIKEGFLKNMTQREIGHLLGISQGQVSKRISKIRAKIVEDERWDLVEMLTVLNARSMQVYRDAYREFHRTRKWQFLQLCLECLRECRESVGSILPRRLEVSGPGGGPIDINDATGMSEDQVDQEIQTIEAELVDHKRPPPAGLLEAEVVEPVEAPPSVEKPKPLSFKAVKRDNST